MELYKSAGLNTLIHLQMLLPLIKALNLQTFKYALEHFVAIRSTSTRNAHESGNYLVMPITLLMSLISNALATFFTTKLRS